MERLKSTAVIFLLALVLFTSAAPAKPASVLLQEGLYAEEIEGDLDAAIKIYEQVISESKKIERDAAHATYRIGMCYLKKGENAKAVIQFSNLVSRFPEQKHIVDNARKQLAKLRLPIKVFEPQALVEQIKSGKVPAFKIQIYDNTGLDLETGVSVPFMDEWPKLCDVAWDNDGGGALMIKPMSSVRFIALGAAENWEDAISMAHNSLSVLRTSTSKGMFARESKFAAVLTSEGNLAVIQIGEYDANKGTIYGWVEKIPAAGFGPEIERVIYDSASYRECFIDFESGEIFKIPEPLRVPNISPARAFEWFTATGIDAQGDTRGSPRSHGLVGFPPYNAAAVEAPGGWNETPETLIAMTQQLTAVGKSKMFAKDPLPTTYYFKTRQGNVGVLQILGFTTGDPRGVKFRYKMVQGQEPIPSLGFGSATEFEFKKPTWIDFEGHSAYSGTAAGGKKSVDVKINLGRDVVYLEGKGTTFALIAGLEWDDLTPYEVRNALAQSQREESLEVRQYPTNYAFQTREGRMGLIQVWGPFPARIRYKMLQDQAKTVAGGWRKVFLPDADTRGTDVVLDFASGELLPAGEGDRQLVGTFAELGKGDLAYDRVLICLRGAKAGLIMPDHAVYDLGEHLVRLKVLEQVEDVTAYQLDIGHIPGRYLVTTGEDKDYEVNILSADARGVELIYKKAIGYKLVERRFEFGPEVERIMQAQGQRDSWIDFDTGRTYPHPEEVVRNGDEKDIIAWARLHGIDALAAYTISGLASHDMTAVRLDESDWNQLTPSQLAKAVALRDAQVKPVKMDGFDFVKLTSIPGSTFGFKTREGGLGILQVVEFMEEPWRVKIRYKMLRPVADKEMVKLKLTKPWHEWWQSEPSVTHTIYEDSQLEIVWDVEPEVGRKTRSLSVGVLPMERDISDFEGHLWFVQNLAFTVRRTPYGKQWKGTGFTMDPKNLTIGEYRIYVCAFDSQQYQSLGWSQMLKFHSVGAATAKLIVRPRPSTQIAKPREAKSPIDLSTPEATIKSFVKAVYDGNLEAAKACVSKDGHDYEEFMEMLATESNHPFQAMIKAMDASIPVEITSKDITEDRCKIKWYFTLGRVYYTGDGETKWKKGMHPEFSSYLELVGDKWLIRDI